MLKIAVSLVAAGLVALGIVSTQSPTVEAKASTIKEFSYAEDIAPVLNAKCVECHRPGETGPMSFVGYDNAKKYSDMIAYVTKERKMPPWKTKPVDVEFHDDKHLSDAEIDMFQAWAKAGAPMGDKSKIPATPNFPVGYKLGTPDMVWKIPYEHTLSPEGKDEYWNFVIKPDIKEPVWVSAIDVKPGNKKIVHHVIAFLDSKGRGEKLAKSNKGDGKLGYLSDGGGVGFTPDGALGGWAPGTNASQLPKDAGFLLKPGTDVILQIHYNKDGKVEKDQTEVAVYLNKAKTVANPVEIAWIANPTIRIPAGESNAKFSQSLTIPQDITVYSVMPHMHLLGKEMRAQATLPDGKVIRLVDVPAWDFNWQLVYGLKQPLLLPKGTKLTVEAVYDNTTDNPFNPSDPPQQVTWGEQTHDEMMLLVVAFSAGAKSEPYMMEKAVATGLIFDRLRLGDGQRRLNQNRQNGGF